MRIPGGILRLFKSAWDWDYTSEPDERTGGRGIYLCRGKTIGERELSVLCSCWGLGRFRFERRVPHGERSLRHLWSRTTPWLGVGRRALLAAGEKYGLRLETMKVITSRA